MRTPWNQRLQLLRILHSHLSSPFNSSPSFLRYVKLWAAIHFLTVVRITKACGVWRRTLGHHPTNRHSVAGSSMGNMKASVSQFSLTFLKSPRYVWSSLYCYYPNSNFCSLTPARSLLNHFKRCWNDIIFRIKCIYLPNCLCFVDYRQILTFTSDNAAPNNTRLNALLPTPAIPFQLSTVCAALITHSILQSNQCSACFRELRRPMALGSTSMSLISPTCLS